MRTPLNTEYKTLTVYFIIHASISPQIRVYSPMFVIKFHNPTFLTRQQSYHFRKYAAKEYTEQSIAQYPNCHWKSHQQRG